ncbi:MAG: hypothetical protein A3H97_01255 [Acidobacteria bacterium RIFCSPLOWO2_02_FULL_65_29]|nr:MAG: hypothetical protein A3H97_01255 [Acidobacteria bacterium RIFCSPLOWO2_02_FULL_65_29]
MRRVLTAVAFLSIIIAGDAARAGAQTADDFRWSGPIALGKSIEIKGVNGDVEAVLASGSQVEVVARKRARRSDAADVRVEVLEHDGHVTICAVYPTPARYSSRNRPGRRDQGPNECRPGDEGRMNTDNNDVQVDFTVRVPAGVRFVGRTVNGRVDATSLQSDVDVYTVNGRIMVSTSGTASAETVNGSIDAAIGDAKWARPLDFHTVNGSITLDLPKNAAAELRAEVMNGDITSDLPLTIQSSRNRGRRITGSIGSGGQMLYLSTTNGSIRLRAAR